MQLEDNYFKKKYTVGNIVDKVKQLKKHPDYLERDFKMTQRKNLRNFFIQNGYFKK